MVEAGVLMSMDLLTGAAPAWPEGARSAVVITVNFDAELFWLRLDASVEHRPKTQSIGGYGARRGVWRLLDALQDARVAASWMVPGSVAERYAAVVRDIHGEGHEIACRGYATERMVELGAGEQRDAVRRGADALGAITGTAPAGFRPEGEIGPDTVAVLDELGFTWSSMLRGDDRPVFLEGQDGATQIVDVPQQWELYDAPYFLFNYAPAYPTGQCRIAGYSRVLEDWKREFDAYHREGLCMVLTLDPQAIGTPGRIGLLRELLAYIDGHDVWWATGAEVADHWRASGPANGADTAEAVRRRAVKQRDAGG
jgi:peptidoglycan/xylan/chitin deacetylase (PgdA/CDA1 family)